MSAEWNYQKAFSRNLGLISASEQEQLRQSRVAVAGLGGVGGCDVVSLARLGIGKFTIADPDVFEIHNINRQYGAMASTAGKSKVEVMSEMIRDINPGADIRVFKDPLGPDNADDFLEGADILVDGIDVFQIDIRRILFRKARERKIFALGAGPVGFSTVWVVFDPQGMEFDRYFDLNDRMSDLEKFVAYIVGMAPPLIQRHYTDLSYVKFKEHLAPSAGLACQLSSAVVTAEVLKILLKRGRVLPAPHYQQFDAFIGQFAKGRLWLGNRHPLQILKRKWLINKFSR